MMISMGSTNLGLTVKKLRETKGISRGELAGAAGISEAHLKKIEAGGRLPGIHTYQKIINVLGADVVIRDVGRTVKGECAVRAQEIFMESTEKQALFMIKVLECMSENMDTAL
ncbi:MAG: helix-turn-helix transcriptional regulator [Acetatifactor muris]|nr:helix-turn-helix transcriptional regulator [Acetatifactor muris]